MFSKAMSGFLVTGLLLSAQAAQAGDHGWKKGPKHRVYDEGYDYAQVVDVDPIVRQVRVTTPRRECWTETRYEQVPRYEPQRVVGPQRGAAGSMILGGILGAAVGNQIGSGDGRRAATVAGAIIGSAIGHDRADRRNARQYYSDTGYREERPYEVERCDVRYDEEYEERIDGYRVTYVYNGREQTTRLPYDPGDRIRVRVNVRPADDY
jgi:uncharacterized protein YcfJ